ncbi:hypothetical protein PUN28_009141 [Cardiocondyla obscurior]|uniref:Uncharacterized protein n=1 Tax=Cardiocondyla obscurior TaxID=286306 RepID=A0AAW2FTZ7_9HYME
MWRREERKRRRGTEREKERDGRREISRELRMKKSKTLGNLKNSAADKINKMTTSRCRGKKEERKKRKKKKKLCGICVIVRDGELSGICVRRPHDAARGRIGGKTRSRRWATRDR